MSFNQAEYVKKYQREQRIEKKVTFNRNSPDDMAILTWLTSRPAGMVKYIKDLIHTDMIEEAKKMKSISIDNGVSTCTPAEAVSSVDWDVIAHYMDDDTREQVAAELAPCTELAFLTRYLEIAPADLIIG